MAAVLMVQVHHVGHAVKPASLRGDLGRMMHGNDCLPHRYWSCGWHWLAFLRMSSSSGRWPLACTSPTAKYDAFLHESADVRLPMSEAGEFVVCSGGVGILRSSVMVVC